MSTLVVKIDAAKAKVEDLKQQVQTEKRRITNVHGVNGSNISDMASLISAPKVRRTLKGQNVRLIP